MNWAMSCSDDQTSLKVEEVALADGQSEFTHRVPEDARQASDPSTGIQDLPCGLTPGIGLRAGYDRVIRDLDCLITRREPARFPLAAGAGAIHVAAAPIGLIRGSGKPGQRVN